MKSWWLDEIAHAGPEHLDEAYVAGYERKAGYDPAEDVDVLVANGLNGDSVVIDLGAGVGTFTKAVSPRCGRVIAVDVSPTMLDGLRRRVKAAGLGNVEIVEGGFLSYEHAGPAADAVFTRNALHQMPDFWKGIALQRIAALLKPGGILRLRDLVFDFEPSETDQRIDASSARIAGYSRRCWITPDSRSSSAITGETCTAHTRAGGVARTNAAERRLRPQPRFEWEQKK